MTLIDTGPLVGLIDEDDPYHALCVQTLVQLPPTTLWTTCACLTEAMYLLWRAGGHRAQELMWGYLMDGLVTLHHPQQNEYVRMRELMRQYRDAPMDLADASLVTAAETLGVRRIFTLDRHFNAYRIEGRHPFDILP
jgi:uncharacterized protein